MRTIARVLAGLCVLLLWVPFAFGEFEVRPGNGWPNKSNRALAVSDSLLFMGRGNLLTIFDKNLNSVGSLDTGSDIYGIFYSANRVYVAAGPAGLKIIDVSAPGSPALVGTYTPIEGLSISGVFVSGNLAYTSSFNNGFVVFDVSDSAEPKITGATRLPGVLVYPINVYVSGNTAAVVDQVNGIHLVDVSDPAAPTPKAIVPIAGAQDVFIMDHYAYVTSAGTGMRVVDISNPSTPKTLGNFAPNNVNFQSITLSGTSAYIADETNGLRTVDVSDPNNPVAGQLFANTVGAYSVALSGADIFVSDFTSGLQKVGDGSYTPPAYAADLFIDTSYYLYIADNAAVHQGVYIVDAIDPGNLQFKGFIATPSPAQSVFAVSGGNGASSYAYIAEGTNGLQIADVTQRNAPTIIGGLDTAGTANDVFVSGNYAYVADGTAGLKIIDIEDKANPTQVGSLDMSPGNANAVFVAGNLAYVAAGDQGLRIADVTDKANPVAGGFLDTDGTAYDIVITGDYAYVADGTAGLVIINVSTPATPTRAGVLDTAGTATGIDVYGDYVRIADNAGGLVTVDASDPTAPARVDAWSVATQAGASKVAAKGEYVYLAEGLAGTALYKLSNVEPFVPTPFNPPDSSGSCFIDSMMGSN